MKQNQPVLPTFFSDLKEAFRDKDGNIAFLDECVAFALWNKASTAKKRSLVYAVKAGSFFRPQLDRLIADFPEAPAGNDGSIYFVTDPAKTLNPAPDNTPENDDENDDDYVTCERCGERIPYDEAHRGFSGYLCDICYDDLFG